MSIMQVRLSPQEKLLNKSIHISALWNPRPLRRNEVTRDDRAQKRICALYREHFSLRELADWFKTSHETIRTILREADVMRRPQRNYWKPELGKEITTAAGYIKVFVGIGYLGAPKNGWIYKHRLVMQEEIGRPLKEWEIVHHIDRNKSNNDKANLKVLSTVEHPTCIACPYYKFYLENRNEPLNT